MKIFWICLVSMLIFNPNYSTSHEGSMDVIQGNILEEDRIKDFPQQIDPCKLKGAVFVEKYRNYADYSVFVEEVEAFGKLKVFKENAAIFATEPGWWYFTDQRGFADFTIYIEETKGFENFTISFTKYRSSAGCN